MGRRTGLEPARIRVKALALDHFAFHGLNRLEGVEPSTLGFADPPLAVRDQPVSLLALAVLRYSRTQKLLEPLRPLQRLLLLLVGLC